MGMSIDWSTCFDRVPQEIAFQLERGKANPRLLGPLRGMYRELLSRFVLAGHVVNGTCSLEWHHPRLFSITPGPDP